MNFKSQAQQLERFLEDEFRRKMPLLVLKDQSIVYKRFKVKQNKNLDWILTFLSGDVIDQFKLKASATIAAKCYDTNNFDRFSEIKVLDNQYWHNANDADFFRQRINSTKDFDKKDIFLARWEVSKERAQQYQQKITSLFRLTFDK